MGTSRSFRVIGDVHGEIEPFLSVTSEARSINRFVVQIGDLIDHGPDSPGCLRIGLKLLQSGQGIFIRGNHERDFAKYLFGESNSASDKLAHTLDKIKCCKDLSLVDDFLEVWPRVPWWLKIDNMLLVHGAFHPAMLSHDSPNAILDLDTRSIVKALCLYGEGPPIKGYNLPPRTYHWIESIPHDLKVVVGHDVRSTDHPVTIVNARGGAVTFLDTGCGKGGRLSWLDFD
jgi:protein phosphatase